ncbi:hypothetical protein H2LOC_010260 [Methylocystis heyeri]|uniref:Uncharacterized protein n=2 Tax=Methylocystis heyeri TaxID=391905 RepID=A0A6B8KLE4_9HYPH|nr:hypothetical protein H2LOC_010260 [Methylocystis heyeri]
MNTARPTSVEGAAASVEQVYYRGHSRSYYPRYGGYYRRGYGYGVPGAAIGAAAGVAGATAGLLGAGVAGATGSGYPAYGYGGGYGGGSCWQWDSFSGWVWRC